MKLWVKLTALVLVIVGAALWTGCQTAGRSDGELGQNVAATPVPGPGQAAVNLAFSLDSPETSQLRPTLRGAASASAVAVTFVTVNPGNTVSPITISTVNATPDANNRVAISTLLPAQPTFTKVHIASGTIGSYTDFRGGLDLAAGTTNTLVVHPSGSRLRQDVIAQVMEHIVNTPTRFNTVGLDLAARVLAALSSVDRTQDLDTVYAAALDAAQRQLAVGRGTGSVTGSVVTDLVSASGRGDVRKAAAVGASVWCEQDPDVKGTVNSLGQFSLTGVPAGPVNIVVDDDKGVVNGLSQRYKVRSPAVTVTPNSTVSVNELRTQYAPNYIQGYVYDELTNAPVAGVRVTVWGQVSTSGADGYYKVFNMPQGTWDVQFEKMGYQTKVDPISFGQGQSTNHNVTIKSLDSFAPIISNVIVTNVTESTAELTFTTNEPGTTQADYGLTDSYGQTTSLNSTLVRDHRVSISSLVRGTVYHVRLKSKDAAGNTGYSADVVFTTADADVPGFSNVLVAELLDTEVFFTWRTDEPTNSAVEYGPTTAYGLIASSSYAMTASHAVRLTGLTPGGTMNYRMIAADAAGNVGRTYNATFKTLSTPPAVTATTPNVDGRPTWTWTHGTGGNNTYRYRLDNSDLSTGYTYTTATTFTPTTVLADGPHTLYVVESNGSEYSKPGSFTVIVDGPPNAPSVTGATNSSSLRPTWTWTAGGGGNGTFRVKLDDGDLSQGATEQTATTFTPTATLSFGLHRLYVQERDGTGNWSASGSFATRVSLDITTLAGTARQAGSTNDTGASARFYSPNGLAIDKDGNLLVADTSNNCIRKVTPQGVVTTFAGDPATTPAVDVDGAAAVARFKAPTGLAVDSTGVVYVSGNQAIRKIALDGTVSTLAGLSGTSGTTDGTGTAARFYSPSGLAIDPSGNVIVADYGNHRLRVVSPTGVVTTLAGGTSGAVDGTGAAARLQNPYFVVVDASGNIFFTDSGNEAIRKCTPAGVVTTFAGTLDQYGTTDGTGLAARFNGPSGLAIDAQGNLYVSDYSNNLIRHVTPTGVVSTIAGAGTTGSVDGVGAAAKFYEPIGIAVSAAGVVYIADRYNYTIRKGAVTQ